MAFISFHDSLNHSWDFLLPGYCFKIFLRETFCPDKLAHILYSVYSLQNYYDTVVIKLL